MQNSKLDLLTDLPPQNLEAEEAILGGIMLDPLAIARVVNILTAPEVFSLPAHQKIYRVCVELYSRGESTDLVCVANELHNRGWLESLGGQSKLARTIDRTVSAVNIDDYANLVKEKWFKRRIIAACQKVLNEAYIPLSKPEELLDLLGGQIQEIKAAMTPTGGIQVVSEIMPDVFEEMTRTLAGEEETFLQTGYYDLDELGGLPVKAMTVVGARTGMGKTTFALNVAHNVASKGYSVAMFSLEMSKSQLGKKLLSLSSKVEVNKLFQPKLLTDNEWGDLANVCASLNLPLWVDEKPRPSIMDIRSELRTVQDRCPSDKPLKLVIVDYVGLMRGENRGNRVTELDFILSDLRAIAKEFKVALIGLAQISRNVESKSDKRPTMSDFRESGGYEQEAALMLSLYNDVYYNPNSPDKGLIELQVLKNRFGQCGKTIKLGFTPELGKFYNATKK